MKFVKIENASLNGSVVLPPSKSAAQRAVICSFLAGGGSVEPIIGSKDMQAAVPRRILNSMGKISRIKP